MTVRVYMKTLMMDQGLFVRKKQSISIRDLLHFTRMHKTFALIEIPKMFIRAGTTSERAMYFIACDEANDNCYEQGLVMMAGSQTTGETDV